MQNCLIEAEVVQPEKQAQRREEKGKE